MLSEGGRRLERGVFAKTEPGTDAIPAQGHLVQTFWREC